MLLLYLVAHQENTPNIAQDLIPTKSVDLAAPTKPKCRDFACKLSSTHTKTLESIIITCNLLLVAVVKLHSNVIATVGVLSKLEVETY